MTPQEQTKNIVDPNFVLVLDLHGMQRLGLTFAEVYAAFDRGIVLTADIYKIQAKQDWMNTLKQNSDIE